MSTEDQIRWDAQHASSRGGTEAAALLRDLFSSNAWPLPRGRALDLAAGKGRNALFLAGLGYDVTAIDISPVALDACRTSAAERKVSIDCRQADLERILLRDADYDLVINFNYLQRSLLPQIRSTLKPGGCVIFETYLVDQAALGHPKNPEHLLRHNELLAAFRNFRVLYYREGRFLEAGDPAFRAGILAQKRF